MQIASIEYWFPSPEMGMCFKAEGTLVLSRTAMFDVARATWVGYSQDGSDRFLGPGRGKLIKTTGQWVV